MLRTDAPIPKSFLLEDRIDVSVVEPFSCNSQVSPLPQPLSNLAMPYTTVKEFLDSHAGVDATLSDIAGAFDAGVVGVPCYRLGGAFLLPGAQSSDVMIQFIDRAKKRLLETE